MYLKSRDTLFYRAAFMLQATRLLVERYDGSHGELFGVHFNTALDLVDRD